MAIGDAAREEAGVSKRFCVWGTGGTSSEERRDAGGEV